MLGDRAHLHPNELSAEVLLRMLCLEHLCSGFNPGLSHLQSWGAGCEGSTPFRRWGWNEVRLLVSGFVVPLESFLFLLY